MEQHFSFILPLSDECRKWCSERKLEIGPVLPVEAPEANRILALFEDQGFREGIDYQLF